MTEWQPSGPEPGKDGPGNLSRATQIAINRPEVRNACHPGNPFELPDAPPVSHPPVIILTAHGDDASRPDVRRKARAYHGDVRGSARLPGRP